MIKIRCGVFRTSPDKYNNPAKRGKMVPRWREFRGNEGYTGAEYLDFGVSELPISFSWLPQWLQHDSLP
jgi:hypothetical protein